MLNKKVSDNIILTQANGDLSNLANQVKELKSKVAAYLAEHDHSRKHEPKLAPEVDSPAKSDPESHLKILSAHGDHKHDQKHIPIKHRQKLDSELEKINALRKEVEEEFRLIGFSKLDTYFCLTLWLSMTLLVILFYCGYNCRVCYARRKPIYRFHHHKL